MFVAANLSVCLNANMLSMHLDFFSSDFKSIFLFRATDSKPEYYFQGQSIPSEVFSFQLIGCMLLLI